MTEPEPRQGSRLALTIGVAACAGGLWLLLNALGVNVPEFKRLWPALFLLAAAASLADFLFFSRHPRSAGWVMAWTGLGLLGLALTMGYTSLLKVLDWLPSFPTILGLSFFTTWIADRRRSTNLAIAGWVLVLLGVLGFAARFDWLQRILPSAQVVWAVLFLAGGAFLVWRTVARSRR